MCTRKINNITLHNELIERFYATWFNNVRRFYFRDDGCDGKTTLGVTAELHYEENVDVYVGMPCSAGTQL